MINDNEIKQLKNLIEKDKKPVLLVPSFKSHADLVLLSYIHMMYEIDLPFVVGMNEFNNISVVSSINKKCGGFLVDSNNL
jgi:glycerol-3-phosphate O-acyltransferase